MQQMMIYWQSVIPQNVSGVFTPIIRTADCVPLPMVPVLAMVVVVSESQMVRRVHCAEDVA
jgi:uncharacterized membrane protein YqiK